MIMELKLQPMLNQKMILSQEMLQSLNILEHSTDELHSLLISKQEKNPFLKLHYKSATHRECPADIRDSSIDFSREIMDQLLHLNLSGRLKYIIKLVLADLSETGFLTQTPNEMALCFRASIEEIHKTLDLLEMCEPKGIGSANLQEFLLMQSKDSPEAVKDILKNYYHLFLHQKWGELTRRSGYSMEDIKNACECISKMKTRPLSRDDNDNLQIRPDAGVSIVKGKLHIHFYEHAFPQLSFDGGFESQIEESIEIKKYLKEHYDEIKVLKEQLELRKETIRKIIEEIVYRQPDFFLNGPESLKSMTMTELSQNFNLHVSTISRAVREKYIMTPYGTFAMRYFFSNSNQFLDETKMTVNQLKKFIFTNIQSEDKRKPISDQEIVNRLKSDGIEISRRVIAKYRHQLNFPSSSKRKNYF